MKKSKVKDGQTNNKKRKNKTIARIVIAIIILILIASVIFVIKKVNDLGGGWRGITAMMLGHSKDTVNNLETIYCLVMGESEELTDTIMLVSYNPSKQSASILSIPRDTFVGKDSNKPSGYDKINSLYRGTSSQKKDAQRTVDAVEKITGLEIPYYAVINTKGVRQLVDLLGGVYFDVPMDMNYKDYSQNLFINLKKGYQKLDGDKAEQVLRFRHNNDSQGRITTTYPAEYGPEDAGRMKTQQAFIIALLKQTLKIENITKINNIIDIMHENLDTNITVKKVKDYVPYAIDFNADNLKTGTVPGQDTNKNATGLWIRLHDKKETQKLVEELFLVNIEQTEDEITDVSTEEDTRKKGDLKIEILNGSSKTSALSSLNTKLKDKGYNIIKANKTTSTAKTTIINRTGVSTELTDELKKAVGAGTVTTGSEGNNVDITIIIGDDYK